MNLLPERRLRIPRRTATCHLDGAVYIKSPEGGQRIWALQNTNPEGEKTAEWENGLYAAIQGSSSQNVSRPPLTPRPGDLADPADWFHPEL